MRIAHVLVVSIGPDLIGKGAARSLDHCAIRSCVDEILTERSAGRRPGRNLGWLTQTEAEIRFAGIGSMYGQQVPSKRTDVGNAEQGVCTHLPVNGQGVLH